MKNETHLSFAKMSKVQLNELTATLKETFASDFVPAKNFTVIDLWNIRRNIKTRANNRHLA